MKTLVTGATGKLGKEVVKQLANKGISVLAATRDISKVAKNSNIEPVIFDYEKSETYAVALENVDSIFLIAPPMDPYAHKKIFPFIDAAQEAGVKQIVVNSALGIDANPEAALFKIENYVKNAGFQYAIIRPNFFMDNFTTGFIAPMIAHQNGIFVAAGNGKTAFIATSDIAAVAVRVITDLQNYNGKIINLTGSEALDHDEAAKIISKAKGQEIKYVPISTSEMKKGAMENGMPEPSADMMLALYGATSAGYMAVITNDFEQVIGNKPLSFEDFINSNIK
ncbi:SDR family oxidoreductase [Saccharicrinis sp. GN24d3]|uniref:SDR family oxidoreductase n=1 Tax=Saccharicrinis sp. GN24d3 TaxID=3458416 RepID=UPI0040375772